MDQRKRNCIFKCHISGIALHQFPNPNKYPDAFAEWINAVGIDLSGKDTRSIFRNKRVCARHFLPEHQTTGHNLLKCAKPTLNLTGVPQSLLTIIELDHSYCCRVVPGKIDSSSATDLAINPLSSTNQTGTSETDPTNEEQHEKMLKHEISVEYNPAVRDSLDAKDFASYNETTIQEVPPDPPKEFSWQDPEATVDLAQDEDGRVPVEYNEENLSLYCSDDDEDRKCIRSNGRTEVHAGFQCDSCKIVITGYRYTCVQCSNYDLCAACEASGVHDQHYVLRVPGPRPPAEVQRVLTRIRSHLSAELNPISNEDDCVSLKSEIKDENEESFYEEAREDICQNDEEVYKEKRDTGQEVAREGQDEAEMSQEEDVHYEADPLRTDDGQSDTNTMVDSDEVWVLINKDYAAESSDGGTNEDIFSSDIPIRPPSPTKTIPKIVGTKEMLSVKTKRIPRLVTPSVVLNGSTLNKLTGLGTDMDNSRLGANMDDSRLGANMDDSRLGANMDDSRLGANMDDSRLGTNMDDSRLVKRTIIVTNSDYEKLFMLQPSAKRVRMSFECS